MAQAQLTHSKAGIEVENKVHPLVKHWCERHNAQRVMEEMRPVDHWDQHGMPVEQDEHFDILERRQANTRTKKVWRVSADAPAFEDAECEERLVGRYVWSGPRWQEKVRPQLIELGYPVN